MNDPQRLIDSDPQASELLRAALREEPSTVATAQLHAALGLEAPVAPLATASAPLLASKWLVLATVAALGGYGAYQLQPAPPPKPVVQAPVELPAAPPVAQASLGDELRRLDLARASLHADPAAALAALDGYDASYPRGKLREEALALRIDALRALHRTSDARELAREFARTYPNSVHRVRVDAR